MDDRGKALRRLREPFKHGDHVMTPSGHKGKVSEIPRRVPGHVGVTFDPDIGADIRDDALGYWYEADQLEKLDE